MIREFSNGKLVLKKVLSLVIVFSFIFSAFALTGCGKTDVGSKSAEAGQGSESKGSDSKENVTVRFGVMTTNIDHQIAMVGLEKGFFEDNGVDLQITEYAAGINTIDALVSDQLDIGIAADFAFLNRVGNTKQNDLRLIANYGDIAAQQLYVNPDEIKDIDDIKGKRILNLTGTIWEYWNVLTAEYKGLSVDDVELVNVDSVANAIAIAQKGDADAFWASGDSAAKLADLGWVSILDIAELDATTTLFFVAKDSYLAKNSEAVEKFYKGFQETLDYINENQEDAIKIINTKTGLSEDAIKAGLDAYDLGIMFKKDIYDYVDNVNKWLYENKYYDYEFDTKDYVDVSIAKKLYPDAVEID